MIKAMVLAAGVGSRLEPISHHLPKPLVPVLNTPVMGHILNLLSKHGVTDVVSNTHYLAEILESHFAEHPVAGMNLRFFREPELSGDAGGVRAAREFLSGGTFIVTMGDLITNADITALVAEHREKGAIATIAVKQVKDVSRFGVMKRDKDGFIQAFQEKPAAGEAISNDISTGLYILEPDIFEHIPSSGVYGFGRQLFPSLVAKGHRVLGAELKGDWSDIGTLKDLFQTNLDALSGKIVMDKPRQSTDPSTLNLAYSAPDSRKLLLGKNLQVEDGVVLGDNVIIGNNVRIGRGCLIQNAVVFADTTVPDGRKLIDCIFAFGEEINMAAIAGSRPEINQ